MRECPAWVVGCGCVGGLCGGGEGDVVAERFDLADVVADLALLVDAAGVVVRAEIAERGAGVGQQMPDDGEGGAGHGDECLALASAFDDASVAFAEEGVGAGGGAGGLTEDALGVWVAFRGSAGLVCGAGLDGARAQL